VQDIVEALSRVTSGEAPKINPNWDTIAQDPGTSSAPFQLLNVGSGSVVGVLDFIDILEKSLNKKAIRRMMPPHPGDLDMTWADCKDFSNKYGNWPRVTLEKGIPLFVEWYRTYFKHV